MEQPILKSEELIKTIEKLLARIRDGFPDSHLSVVCGQLLEVAKEAPRTVDWISKPNHWVRIAVAMVMVLLVGLLIYSVSRVDVEMGKLRLAELVQVSESAMNEIILIGAGIVFLVTFETRRKRKRIIAATNKLRCLAHIIDAHQLTKDPDRTEAVSATEHSPSHSLSDYEMGRYLDYCSKMLSLTGKLAFLYVQNFSDPVANEAVDDLGNLTNDLSRNIWQKIVILRGRQAG